MTRRWNVAVAGLGHWYSAYGLARSLAEYPYARLAAVSEQDPAQLAAFTSTFGVPGYSDHREMLARFLFLTPKRTPRSAEWSGEKARQWMRLEGIRPRLFSSGAY